MDNIRSGKVQNINQRNRKETIFKTFGKISILFSISFLIVLFAMIFIKSKSAFVQTKILLEINLSEENLAKFRVDNEINFRTLVKSSIKENFPTISSISDLNLVYQMFSKINAIDLQKYLEKNPDKIGDKINYWLIASSKIDVYFKHQEIGSMNEKQKIWIDELIKKERVKTFFNSYFFSNADSKEAEIAGISAGILGSFLVMIIFLASAFPIAVMCAFYLEEFAPKNKITDIIEISINNLAAIPSIIYGLLGLTVYLQFFYLPRSSSLVGGMTLFMLVLPIIIIATRNTIRSIPSSIRDAAAALGASKIQIIWHHLFPLSIPGIMTGTILAISRALGETAPLLMIGMVAFIADKPNDFSDATTVLPVQIYLWSDSAEIGFAEKTAATILILLIFLIMLNLVAIILRKKFEKKW
jgi:phosphate transport system permease protein